MVRLPVHRLKWREHTKKTKQKLIIESSFVGSSFCQTAGLCGVLRRVACVRANRVRSLPPEICCYDQNSHTETVLFSQTSE
jgi:hypothetical protein